MRPCSRFAEKENSVCGEKGQSEFEFKLPDELKM
jgi:hypothetical protein